MQRRALAFQIANIATFVTLDAFISKLFALLTKKPISGYHTVSLAQIIAADQALWQKVSQETRGKILTSGDPKPVDKAVLDFMDAAEVTYHLLPVRDHPKPDPAPKDPKPNSHQSLGILVIADLQEKTEMARLLRLTSQMAVLQRMIQTKIFALHSIAKHVQSEDTSVAGAYMFAGGRIASVSMLSQTAQRESQMSDMWKARAAHLVTVRAMLHVVSPIQMVCKGLNCVFQISWRSTYGTFILAGIRRF